MPVQDRRLAGFPTQKDRLARADGGKVDQPQVDVFDDAAQRFDPVDQPVYFQLEIAEAGGRKRRPGGGEPLRVRLLYVVDRRVRFEQLDGQVAAPRQQIFDERRQLRQ